jgi:hypothetical protein
VGAVQLLRLSGIAAIAGGLLRLGGTFAPLWLPASEQAALYFATDIFLLLGFTGLYISRSEAAGWPGLFGYLLGFVGLLVVRSYPASYFLGAAMFSAGITLIAVLLLVRGAFPKWIAGFWIASFLAGLASLVVRGSDWPVTIAGILFSLGFIAAGAVLWRERAA